jgi:hypothetical protein
MLLRYRDEGGDILLSIVTVNNSLIRHLVPETKQQNIEWHRLYSPTKKKPKTEPSAENIGTNFRDTEGCSLIGFLDPRKIINFTQDNRTLHKLCRAWRVKYPRRKVFYSTMTLCFTLLLGNIENMVFEVSSLTFPTVLVCEESDARSTKHSRQLFISVFGQLKCSSPAREFSNFKNGRKISIQ